MLSSPSSYVSLSERNSTGSDLIPNPSYLSTLKVFKASHLSTLRVSGQKLFLVSGRNCSEATPRVFWSLQVCPAKMVCPLTKHLHKLSFSFNPVASCDKNWILIGFPVTLKLSARLCSPSCWSSCRVSSLSYSSILSVQFLATVTLSV